MTGNYELTWHRNPGTGDYTAADDRDQALYAVSRLTSQPPGRQWMLTAIPLNGTAQHRYGFATMTTAKAAALESRCHLCFRHRPFAALEMAGPQDINGWHCRDREECDAIAAARDEESRRVTREIRATDMSEIEVRDTEDGPELVFRHDYGTGQKHGTVIACTEGDLLRLSYVLLTWFRTRYADELALITEARKAARS
jgi:hypothetical protein